MVSKKITHPAQKKWLHTAQELCTVIQNLNKEYSQANEKRAILQQEVKKEVDDNERKKKESELEILEQAIEYYNISKDTAIDGSKMHASEFKSTIEAIKDEVIRNN